MSRSAYGVQLKRRLDECPPGAPGWQQFEAAALDVLTHLFVPPLEQPRFQARSYSGIDRMDAIFPNRITDTAAPWGLLRHDLDAKLILVEFKNYAAQEIGKEEIDQTRNYLKRTMGRLALVCCNKAPTRAAYIRRNTIYSEDKKVILFLTTSNLKEMIDIEGRNEDPAAFILDSVDDFSIQYE